MVQIVSRGVGSVNFCAGGGSLRQILLSQRYGVLEDGQQWAVAYQRGIWGFQTPPPRNSEVSTKLSRIPSSVENTSVIT
jgi:hypothetical protein